MDLNECILTCLQGAISKVHLYLLTFLQFFFQEPTGTVNNLRSVQH